MIAALHSTIRFTAISLLALYLGLPATFLQAQYRYKWMTIGRLHSPYTAAGALRIEEADAENQLAFPAIEKNSGNKISEGLWVAVKDFTDETGKLWPVKIAHLGPRDGGTLQFFSREFKLVSRFEPPVVRVNGNISFRYWSVVDEVDPTLRADRMIYNRNVNRVGIELEQKVYAFDQQFHDNYHIIEYTFTNTGDVDKDEDVELPDQVLNGVYFFWIQRYAFHAASAWITGDGAPWGRFTMNDAVGDGHEDYGVDFTAQYAWAGYNPKQTEFNSLGQPMWRENPSWWSALSAPGDTLGRLAAGHFAGRVYIHADKAADDETNAVDPTPAGTWPDGADPADLAGRQPSTMGFLNSDHPDLAESEYDESLMLRQYNEHITTGRYYPHHADLVEPSDEGQPPGQYFATPRPESWETIIPYRDGWSFVEGFGPYSMSPGDDVHLVVAEGVAGLSDSAKLEIGIAYKASGADDALDIEWPAGSGVSMTKNEWVMTSRDSLFDMFKRAKANYESGFDIPKAPLPPATFDVTSFGGAIDLKWETYAGELDPVAWEVWRTSPIFHHSAYYERIATLPGSARAYRDAVTAENGPIVNLGHFYYLQAVGPVNTDVTGKTPTGESLKSNRYYTQTYFPVMSGRLSDNLDDIVIVPNPYHIGADEDIRYPDIQDKLGFLDLPGYCTIRIYTQLGELIDIIEHTDGTGDEYWDHTTASRQVVVSGLYIAVITDNETNEKVMKKFVIVR
ncbi:MAG: hypothetical protein JSU77_03155 [Fidelibacterota bacterium]|nr:MAG: hypothetical protein JSU77_03155 [Candidatus Neomarinimicrobiota bacterium]